jgi:hypothetical protein
MTIRRKFFHSRPEEKQDAMVMVEAPDLQMGRNGAACLLQGLENQRKDLLVCECFGGQMGNCQLFPGEEQSSSLGEHGHRGLQRFVFLDYIGKTEQRANAMIGRSGEKKLAETADCGIL